MLTKLKSEAWLFCKNKFLKKTNECKCIILNSVAFTYRKLYLNCSLSEKISALKNHELHYVCVIAEVSLTEIHFSKIICCINELLELYQYSFAVSKFLFKHKINICLKVIMQA